MAVADPARDCPPCPECKGELGTPIRDSNGDLTTDRHTGPNDATLWCPACGHGWVGTPADVDKANASWDAYQAEMSGIAGRIKAGQRYRHPQAGIEAEVRMVGKRTHTEDDAEFGMVSVDVPYVFYAIFLDGRWAGAGDLPEADFRKRFGLGNGRPDKRRPWS